jgi:predicted transcriptional regulator
MKPSPQELMLKILQELAILRMVERGLEDSGENRTFSSEEMEQRISSWVVTPPSPASTTTL